MKALAVAFSARKEGNCSALSRYCLERLTEQGWETEFLAAYEHKLTPCSNCDYECMSEEPSCPISDDVPVIYRKCLEADVVIFAVPDYCGHLSSLYFSFVQRGQSVYKIFPDFNHDFLRKINFLITGNLSAGGDMALHEALYNFAGQQFWPETLLFPAREYGKNSLKGDLLEVETVRERLDRFVEMITKKAREVKR